MVIKAILFDADGVVIFPHRFSDYRERELNLAKEATEPFFEGVFLECLVGRADLKEVIAPFLQSWGWEASVDDFIKCWFDVENAVDQRMSHVITKLRKHGYFCGLATNQERYRIEYMRTEMGFSTIFDEIFSSVEIGAMKNELRYFEIVTARLGLPADKILFWDDSQSNVEMARLFGWQAERFTTFEAFEESLRQYLSQG